MTTIVAREKITLEPKYLNDGYIEHIRTKLSDKMSGQCNQKYGYILGIEDEIKIHGNEVSSANAGIFFDVEFSIISLKPKKGQQLDGTVCMVFQHGVFVLVEEKMKVLIPTDKMPGYKFSTTKNRFKKGSRKISVGDTISVVLEMIKYEHQSFDCIGSLVE
jgi:DNA-directed RNA polymerase subunit E'/Rpb7